MSRYIAFLEGSQGLQTLKELLRYTPEILVVVPEGWDNSEILAVARENNLDALVRSKGVPLGLPTGEAEVVISSQFQHRIYPSEWQAAREGGVNIHASILPTYRGKHSDVWALINDEREIGVTVHRLANEFDAGEILHIEYLMLSDAWPLGEIYRRVSALIPGIVRKIVDGSIFEGPTRQPPPLDIYWRVRTPEDSRINWHVSARKQFCFIRALSRVPIFAFSHYQGRRFEFVAVRETERRSKALPGTVELLDERAYVVCGDGGVVEVVEVRSEVPLRSGMLLH